MSEKTLQMKLDLNKELQVHNSLKEVLRRNVKPETISIIFYNTPSTPAILNELVGLYCWIKKKYEKPIEIRFE